MRPRFHWRPDLTGRASRVDGADPGANRRRSGRGSSGHDMRSRRTPDSRSGKDLRQRDFRRIGGRAGGTPAREQSRRDTAHDGHDSRPEKATAPAAEARRQEAACARPGGYLFVSDIRPMEVWRTLVVGRVVRKRRARLRWSRNAEEHERGERLEQERSRCPPTRWNPKCT